MDRKKTKKSPTKPPKTRASGRGRYEELNEEEESESSSSDEDQLKHGD